MLVDVCNDMEMDMRALQTFSQTRFANSIRYWAFDLHLFLLWYTKHEIKIVFSFRMVTINLREDFAAVIQCLHTIERDLENQPSTQNREKLADARRILKSIKNKQFGLELSGISDAYDQFGKLVNVVQKVDLLPFERYSIFIC